MNVLYRTAWVVAACLSVVGLVACGALPAFEPKTNETRTVQAASDPAKVVTVSDGMVWYAGPSRESGIRFPAGNYMLEAEDGDYWYFASVAPLEFRQFSHGRPTEQNTSAGGLMLGKHSLRLVPAAGYIDGDGPSKVMVWKLGGDFLAMEGHQWHKSW
jgi:hypothetical protein